jgi:hypothetical protein
MSEAAIMDAELKAALDGIRADINSFRKETTKNFRTIRMQLNTLEYGVLTISLRIVAFDVVLAKMYGIGICCS